jgi:hypothetical protein
MLRRRDKCVVPAGNRNLISRLCSLSYSDFHTYSVVIYGGTLDISARFPQCFKTNACHLLACWFLAKLISSTLKMEAIYSSETSVDTQRTPRRNIPEDDTLHNHRCENLKSSLLLFVFVSCHSSSCQRVLSSFYCIDTLAEMPGVARVDHRNKGVSLVAISLSHNFETRNCWPA